MGDEWRVWGWHETMACFKWCFFTDCTMVNHHLSGIIWKIMFFPPKKKQGNQPNPILGFPEFGWIISGDLSHQDTTSFLCNTSFPNTTCAVDTIEICGGNCPHVKHLGIDIGWWHHYFQIRNLVHMVDYMQGNPDTFKFHTEYIILYHYF